jgi:hypothetical protein
MCVSIFIAWSSYVAFFLSFSASPRVTGKNTI